MNKAQLDYLIELKATCDVRLIDFNSNYTDGEMFIGYYDRGGNYHTVSIDHYGRLHTYTEEDFSKAIYEKHEHATL